MSYAAYELKVPELTWYLDRILPIVERFIEPIKLPEFRRLCERYHHIDDFARLAIEFRMQEHFAPEWWSTASFQFDPRHDSCRPLIAVANFLAMPRVQLHGPGGRLPGTLINLAGLLGFDSRPQEIHRLFEFALGWDANSYRNRKALGESLAAFAPRSLDYLLTFSAISQELTKAERLWEAEQVTFAALGLVEEKVPNAEHLCRAVSGIMQWLVSDLLPQFHGASDSLPDPILVQEVGMCVNIAQILRRRHVAIGIEFVERFSGFAPGAASRSVVRRLQRRFAEDMSKRMLEVLIGQFVGSLTFMGRTQDSIDVAESLFLIEGGDYDDEVRLRERLERYRSEAASLDDSFYLIGALAGSLLKARRFAHGASLVESAFAKAGDGDRLSSAISGARKALRPTNIGVLVAEHVYVVVAVWVAGLAESGRLDDAQRVTREVLGDLNWLRVENGRLRCGFGSVLTTASLLLRYIAPHDSAFGIELCRILINAIRVSIADSRVSAVDRRHYQEELTAIRQHTVRLGYNWAATAKNATQRHERLLEAILWDAELGQRAVLERFLQGQPAPKSPAPRRLRRLNRDGIGPVAPALAIDDELEGACYDRIADSEGKRILRLETSVADIRPEVERLSRQLTQGIGPADLARGMQDDELLLRAGFTADGRLMWALLAPDHERLRVVIDHVGIPTDFSRLTAAAARYEAELETTWLLGRWPVGSKGAFEKLALLIETVSVAIADGASAEHDWNAFLTSFAKSCVQCNLPDSPAASLRKAYEGYFASEADESPDRQAKQIQVLDRLKTLFTWPKDSRTARQRRDLPTEALLRSVAEVWGLAPLADKLDCKRHHLLVQVDDVLHAVPIAYLPVGGKLLFESVRSTRSVLSTVLNGWLAERERIRTDRGANHRGLVLSRFDPGDKAAFGTPILVGAMTEAVEGWNWGFADGSDGTHEVLATAVEDPLTVAIVFAHGRTSPRGVQLADGIWGGSRVYVDEGSAWRERPGCDLGNIEFLLQVSCTIGRVDNGEGRDVAGFCVETAVAGACSVMAAKWPIAVIEAPLFAAYVATVYRKTREQLPAAEHVDAARLRAEAVNSARLHFHTARAADVGLNTAAAFDLYGLG